MLRLPADRVPPHLRSYFTPVRDQAKSLMGLPWRYALGCIDGKGGLPLILRSEMIWAKPNGL